MLPVFFLWALAGAPDASTVTGDPRAPLPTVVITPSASRATIGTSDLLRAASRSIEARSRFTLDVIGDVELGECEGRLSCILERTRARFRPDAPHFLLLSLLARSGAPDRLSIFLVDLTSASRIQQAGGDPEEIERRIDEEAITFRAGPAEVVDSAAIAALIEPMAAERLGAALGSIAIESAIEGAAIEIDGRPLGIMKSRDLKIVDVRPGTRSLSLMLPDRTESRITLEVVAAEEVRWTPVFVRPADPEIAAVRRTVFWSGVGVAALGAAIVTYALASTDSVTTACLGVEGADLSRCERASFISFNRDADVAPTFTSAVDRGGVLIAPFGYSLMLTGAAWSLGTALFESDELPWIEVGAGLVAGVAAYGISHALGSERAFD